jgi:hypothetical protein
MPLRMQRRLKKSTGRRSADIAKSARCDNTGFVGLAQAYICGGGMPNIQCTVVHCKLVIYVIFGMPKRT